jgi:hypothetical protein
MSTPNESAKGVKTLGIRLQPDVHAQLSFIAQLREGTITDEILIAITEHIARAKDDPDLQSRADEAREEIEREAAARQRAIATLFDPSVETPPGTPESGDEAPGGGRSRTTRRGQKGGPRASVIPFGFTQKSA